MTAAFLVEKSYQLDALTKRFFQNKITLLLNNDVIYFFAKKQTKTEEDFHASDQ